MKLRVVTLGLALVVAFAVADAYACATCGCQAKAKCPMKDGKTACPMAAKVAAAAEKDHGYAEVDTAGLEKLLESKDGVTLVDARFGKYDDGRRIADASQLAANASDEDIQKALPDKDAKIVAYCTSTKCPASEKLAHRLVDLGYKDVVKYPDGIEGWAAAGKPVTDTKKN